MPQPDHDEPLLPSSSASSEPHEDDGSETGVTRSAVAAALINTLKSVLGTGLLAMPWAFLQLRTHLEMAIILCIILGVWCCYTMVLIHECAVLAWPAARTVGTAPTSTFATFTATRGTCAPTPTKLRPSFCSAGCATCVRLARPPP